MRVEAVLGGDLRRILDAELRATERAVTRGMSRTAGDLKQMLRDQITGAGMGRRLANTVRSETYPKNGVSLSPAALVWTKAPQIVRAFDEGTVIRSRDGFWLAIPTDAVPRRLGGKRPTPALVEQIMGLRLRFVYRRGRSGLLVADGARLGRTGQARALAVRRSRNGGEHIRLNGRATVPMFVLVPSVRMPKRLNWAAAARRAEARLAPNILAAIRESDGR
jgi:hypothetical protein